MGKTLYVVVMVVVAALVVRRINQEFLYPSSFLRNSPHAVSKTPEESAARCAFNKARHAKILEGQLKGHYVAESDKGWFVKNTEHSRVQKVIYFIHGLSQSRHEFAAFVSVVLERCPECGLFLFDLDNCGQNIGYSGHTFGERESFTVLEHMKTTLEQHRLQPLEVYLVGMSAGGASSIITAYAAKNAGVEIAGVVALASYSSSHLIIAKHLGLPETFAAFVCKTFHFVRSRLDDGVWVSPVEALKLTNRKSIPLLLVHGDKDGLIAIAHMHHLRDAATQSGLDVKTCVASVGHSALDLYSSSCQTSILAHLKIDR